MRHLLTVLVAAVLCGPLQADGERAGTFDYYVLSLSWSPNWCALEGDARGSPQCDDARDFGWVLHGLWPQYERGWPSNCLTTARNPSRSDTAAMADIMGTSGLAWYQWQKHGRCSGLNSEDYFALSRQAFEAIERPDVFRRIDQTIRLPALVVEEAFLETNPDLTADGLTVTCKAGRVQEVRICLTKTLRPRDCGADVLRDCDLDRAIMEPVR